MNFIYLIFIITTTFSAVTFSSDKDDDFNDTASNTSRVSSRAPSTIAFRSPKNSTIIAPSNSQDADKNLSDIDDILTDTGENFSDRDDDFSDTASNVSVDLSFPQSYRIITSEDSNPDNRNQLEAAADYKRPYHIISSENSDSDSRNQLGAAAAAAADAADSKQHISKYIPRREYYDEYTRDFYKTPVDAAKAALGRSKEYLKFAHEAQSQLNDARVTLDTLNLANAKTSFNSPKITTVFNRAHAAYSSITGIYKLFRIPIGTAEKTRIADPNNNDIQQILEQITADKKETNEIYMNIRNEMFNICKEIIQAVDTYFTNNYPLYSAEKTLNAAQAQYNPIKTAKNAADKAYIDHENAKKEWTQLDKATKDAYEKFQQNYKATGKENDNLKNIYINMRNKRDKVYNLLPHTRKLRDDTLSAYNHVQAHEQSYKKALDNAIDAYNSALNYPVPNNIRDAENLLFRARHLIFVRNIFNRP